MGKPSEIIEFFNGMLSKREFFIPLTAAQYQFPHHYYGLTSAALLEDLFVDAAINYQKIDRRDVALSRPERKTADDITDAKGEKGWDYKFQDQHFSHKVGKDVSGIALLWDPTFNLPEDMTYSYPSPIVFVLAQYKGKNGKIHTAQSKVDITPVAHFRSQLLKKNQSVLICRRDQETNWTILSSQIVSHDDTSLYEILPLEKLWEEMLDAWSSGSDVNQVDVFVTKSRKDMRGLNFSKGDQVKIEFVALPGVYLFPKEELQNVIVEKNNRGVLLPKGKVLELVERAATTDDFAFLPNWYTAYAGPRNVDLYQVQRAEYDQLTTAARR